MAESQDFANSSSSAGIYLLLEAFLIGSGKKNVLAGLIFPHRETLLF